ncbi:MAG: hypothetical protein HYW85_01620 [Deltaproteobacteria bacterium]|nr:hypothetical protein [Deltaproteobacteria bacterium]
MRAYALAQVEAASRPETTLASITFSQEKVNAISPELKAGSNYVKPGLSVKNILNTHIHTNISYQTQEEILEAKLFKKLSETVKLELTNTNTFKNDRVKRVLLGLSYNF